MISSFIIIIGSIAQHELLLVTSWGMLMMNTLFKGQTKNRKNQTEDIEDSWEL